MKQRKITYISIQEERVFYSHLPKGKQIEMKWYACIQENKNSENSVRGHYCSEASILRLAKIQEKLAK